MWRDIESRAWRLSWPSWWAQPACRRPLSAEQTCAGNWPRRLVRRTTAPPIARLPASPPRRSSTSRTFRVSSVAQVLSSAGENMGRVIDVVVDRSGQVRAAVIDFGGFLGRGQPQGCGRLGRVALCPDREQVRPHHPGPDPRSAQGGAGVPGRQAIWWCSVPWTPSNRRRRPNEADRPCWSARSAPPDGQSFAAQPAGPRLVPVFRCRRAHRVRSLRLRSI